MKRLLMRIAAGAALVLAAAPAGAVGTGQAPPQQTFNASLTAIDPRGAGALEAVLQLQIGSDGSISGYYRTEGHGISMRPVIGQIDGNKVWLQIGTIHTMRIEGTYDEGTIVGYTEVYAPWAGDPRYPYQYRFVAHVTASAGT